jgi:hypothetical protein
MSDAPATDPTTPVAARTESGGAKPADETGAAPEKPPQRSVTEIRADIEQERGELSGSFARLREELDETVDAGKRRASEAGKKMKKVAPLVAGAAATLVVAGALVRRRSRR